MFKIKISKEYDLEVTMQFLVILLEI